MTAVHLGPSTEKIPLEEAVNNPVARTGEVCELSPGIEPRLLKNSRVVRERARFYLAIDEPVLARWLLETAIRTGGWHKAGLWWELVASMSTSSDYQVVRDLWLSSPERCHNDASILRAVARAACISGWHEDSRSLLRKAALSISSEARVEPSTLYSRIVSSSRRLTQPRGKAQGGANDLGAFMRSAAEALVDLNEAFRQLGSKAFLISGTLLGLIREGKIIGWDKDIDVGVLEEDMSPEMEKFFRRHERFHFGRVDLTTDRLRIIHANGTWIDVFPHYREGGKVWHDGSATRWWNSPFGLKKMTFLGIDQYVPDEPEKYLEENYGDWRTPVSGFDARLDAPNVQVTDQEHFDTLLFFSLESSLRKGNDAMTHRYRDLLRAMGEGNWLNRI